MYALQIPYCAIANLGFNSRAFLKYSIALTCRPSLTHESPSITVKPILQEFFGIIWIFCKGGHLSAWIYGAENNEWITRFVDPIRTGFTSKISQPTLLQLSKLPTLGVYLSTKLVYRPLNSVAKPIAKHLFYNEYLNHLGTFGWREQHNIVFDHLVAPTAFYISKADFETWWTEIKAENVEIIWHNQNSWCGFGTVK